MNEKTMELLSGWRGDVHIGESQNEASELTAYRSIGTTEWISAQLAELKYQKEQTKEWQKKCGLMHKELSTLKRQIADGELVKVVRCKFEKDGRCHAAACFDSSTKCGARTKTGNPKYAEITTFKDLEESK